MASPTTSTNPFRRKSLAAPGSSTPASTSSLKPALVPSSVFDADPELDTPDPSATPRSKAVKTVRVQSPPIKVAAPTASTDSLETCSTSTSTSDPDDADTNDPFGADLAADEPDDAAVLSPVGIPHNPFSKTLGDLEPHSHDVKAAAGPDDPAQTPVQQRKHTSKPSMDVEAFSRLLLTGSTGLETASSRPTSSGVGANEDGSATMSPQTATQTHKKPPPPPSSRHGRSIKSVDHGHTGPGGPGSTSSALPISPRRGGQVSSPESSRPLPITPPPPRRARNEARITSNELPQLNTTFSQDGVKPAKPESATRAPAPPPPRRPYQKTSAPASPAQADATLSQSSPPPTVSPPVEYPTSTSPPQIGPPGVRAKPPPPPARNSSVRRPQSIALSPPSSKQPGLSRKASNASTRSHVPQPPPPPPVPRQRGSAKGADSVSASTLTSPVAPAVGMEFSADSGPDIMAEITALQREVEAAMQQKNVGGG